MAPTSRSLKRSRFKRWEQDSEPEASSAGVWRSNSKVAKPDSTKT